MADDRNAEHAVSAELGEVAEFRLALRRFERQTERVVRRCGLTQQRYLLLLVVETASGEATVSTISRDMQMPQSTTTDLVARAVQAGLIDRHVNAVDGRIGLLSATKEGRRRLSCALNGLGAERLQLRATLLELSRLI